MFRRFNDRFGIPGVISVIALVFAMLGGAYAASNSGSGGKATASAKAKKGPRGPKGPKGATGAQGPVGPAGAPGKDGTNGTNGTDGANGQDGAPGDDGKSVTSAPIAANGVCGKKTGVKYTLSGTPTNVCSGEDGKDGETGFTETLPPGQTETGTWSYSEGSAEFFFSTAQVAISFPIPLEEGGESFGFNRQQTQNQEFGSSGCQGTVSEPTAPPGVLCIYTATEELEHTSNFGPLTYGHVGGAEAPESYGTTGGFMWGFFLEGTPATPARAGVTGTWAVTAPEP